MVNSEELIGTTERGTSYARCRLNRCRYNRVRLYLHNHSPTYDNPIYDQPNLGQKFPCKFQFRLLYNAIKILFQNTFVIVCTDVDCHNARYWDNFSWDHDSCIFSTSV
jgi:hypothetical protein